MVKMYDIIIIGSGPAGLTAAIYASRAELNALVIEKEYQGTGQIAESERVENYPGLYGESGFDLGEKFREHALSLGAKFTEGEVTFIQKGNDFYKVGLSDCSDIETRTIIYAAGAKPNRLNIEGENKYSGCGVSYCAICDGAFYKDKTVAVVGGGDTALSDALLLSKTAKLVYVIHRREELRANKALQTAANKTENIRFILNAVPVEITGDKKVHSLKFLRNNVMEELEVSGVFVAVGTVPQSGLLKGIAELDGSGYVIAGEDCATSAEGIFAAGDVRTKQLRQVITAAADGAVAVHSAENYLLKSSR